MRRALAVLLAMVLLTAMLPLAASGFAVDPKFQIQKSGGNIISCSTLSAAVSAAEDGDTIMLAAEVMSDTVSEGVTITKKVTFMTGKNFGGSRKSMQYDGTTAPLFTVAEGGSLTVIDSLISGNSKSTLTAGGFVYVEKGGTLIPDGKTGSEVTIKTLYAFYRSTLLYRS